MLIKVFLLIPILIFCASCTPNSTDSIPQPTKTIYVPVPQSGSQPNIQEDYESDLEEIRQANCRLATDLFLQHIDLDREASSLENQANGFDYGSDSYRRLKEQANNLKNQSINLLFQSARLRENC